jgi:hypothetical protein
MREPPRPNRARARARPRARLESVLQSPAHLFGNPHVATGFRSDVTTYQTFEHEKSTRNGSIY